MSGAAATSWPQSSQACTLLPKPQRAPLPAEAPSVSGASNTNSLGGNCSVYAPLVSGTPDCGNWDSGVRYKESNLQRWQIYYNWHDGMTSSWNFNFKNQARGYEAWGANQPDYWGAGELNAQFRTDGLFNDLNAGSGLGFMCRTWSEYVGGPGCAVVFVAQGVHAFVHGFAPITSLSWPVASCSAAR
jgi:hypothetical protein